jgi:hypothetical protein
MINVAKRYKYIRLIYGVYPDCMFVYQGLAPSTQRWHETLTARPPDYKRSRQHMIDILQIAFISQSDDGGTRPTCLQCDAIIDRDRGRQSTLSGTI